MKLRHSDVSGCKAVVFLNSPYCSFVFTGGLIFIIFREAKHSGVYLTCIMLLLPVWLSDGVYLNIAVEFI